MHELTTVITVLTSWTWSVSLQQHWSQKNSNFKSTVQLVSK